MSGVSGIKGFVLYNRETVWPFGMNESKDFFGYWDVKISPNEIKIRSIPFHSSSD